VGSLTISACIRRSAIGVQRSLNGRRVVLNSHVCDSEAISLLTSDILMQKAAYLNREMKSCRHRVTMCI
jgi:hypothetical protein